MRRARHDSNIQPCKHADALKRRCPEISTSRRGHWYHMKLRNMIHILKLFFSHARKMPAKISQPSPLTAVRNWHRSLSWSQREPNEMHWYSDAKQKLISIQDSIVTWIVIPEFPGRQFRSLSL